MFEYHFSVARFLTKKMLNSIGYTPSVLLTLAVAVHTTNLTRFVKKNMQYLYLQINLVEN